LPILPPPAVLHRLPFVASKCEPWAVQEVPSWTVKGWPVRQDGFIATSSIAKQKPGTGNLEGFPRGGLICYLKTNDLKNHLKSWKFHPLSVLKILRCS
jgi:hypothetical protein